MPSLRNCASIQDGEEGEPQLSLLRTYSAKSETESEKKAGAKVSGLKPQLGEAQGLP